MGFEVFFRLLFHVFLDGFSFLLGHQGRELVLFLLLPLLLSLVPTATIIGAVAASVPAAARVLWRERRSSPCVCWGRSRGRHKRCSSHRYDAVSRRAAACNGDESQKECQHEQHQRHRGVERLSSSHGGVVVVDLSLAVRRTCATTQQAR